MDIIYHKGVQIIPHQQYRTVHTIQTGLNIPYIYYIPQECTYIFHHRTVHTTVDTIPTEYILYHRPVDSTYIPQESVHIIPQESVHIILQECTYYTAGVYILYCRSVHIIPQDYIQDDR